MEQVCFFLYCICKDNIYPLFIYSQLQPKRNKFFLVKDSAETQTMDDIFRKRFYCELRYNNDSKDLITKEPHLVEVNSTSI